MSLKHSAALLAASLSLIAAPAALASGSGSGNTSTTGTTSVPGGPAGSAGFGAGGASGTSGINGGGGGGTGGGGGGTASGNPTNSPAPTCTIATLASTFSWDPVSPTSLDIFTHIVIPAGCPGRSSFQLVWQDVTSGGSFDYFNSTGLATSGSAGAVTPGTDLTIGRGGLTLGDTYTVHAEIDTASGQLITQTNETVVAAP
jgi:hypothetical protein